MKKELQKLLNKHVHKAGIHSAIRDAITDLLHIADDNDIEIIN